MRVTILAICLSTACSVWGQSSTVMDQLVNEGTEAMYRLEYGVAIDTFARIIEEYPESPVGYGMMSTAAWNAMLYAAANPTLHDFGTPNPYSDSEIHKPIEDEVLRFHQAIDRLLEVCEEILEHDPENVLALYFRGLAYENLAAEAIVISEDRWGAVGPGREAKGIHDDVLDLDPDFVDAKVSVASYEYALATVDGFAKVVLVLPRLFGFFRGDKDEAFEMMEEVLRLGKYRSLDAQVLLSIMHAFEGDPLRSVEILEDLGRRYPENYMIDLNLAAVYELRVDDGAEALRVYQALLEALPDKSAGLGEAEVYFRIGSTHFRQDEYPEARAALERAVNSPATESETVPLAYFYLGMIEEASGSEARAEEYYRQFVSLAESMASLEGEVEDANRRLR